MTALTTPFEAVSAPALRPRRISVAVVDEHEMVLRGLAASLAEDPWFDVVTETRSLTRDVDVAVVSRQAAQGTFNCPIIVCTDEPFGGAHNRVAGVLQRRTLTGAQLRASVHAAVAGLQVHHGKSATPRVEPREREVLTLLADGLTTREIGDRIGYSERTVKKRVTLLAEEFGAKNRAQLVAQAIREGII